MAIDLSPAPFTWGAGGARMTPEAIASQRKVAQAMMQQGMDYSPIQSPWQGAARVAQAMLGGLESGQADAAAKANQEAEAKLLSDLLSGGATAAPTAAPATPAASAAPMGANAIPAGQPDASLSDAISKVAAARGVDPAYMTRLAMVESGGKLDARSPLSSASGPFQFLNSTARQYGLNNPMDPAASADAAARFTLDNKAALANRLGREPTPGELYLAHQQGAGAAANLLANPDAPVESIIGPAAARNNGATPGMTAGQFASKWTGKFGDIVQTVDPAQKTILDAAADQPATAVAQADPAALPVNAQAAQGFAIPGQGATPQAAPGVNPALVRAMSSPYVSDGTKKILGLLLTQQMKPNDYSFATLPDGTILRQDPRKGTVEPIYQAPSKPTFGVVGEDQFGNKQYGWIDAYKRTAEPMNGGGAASGASPSPVTVTGVDGKPVAVPAGQNPKIFRDEITKSAADAVAGKKTEVQANSEQFANRMETAEHNLSGLQGEASGVAGAAQQIFGQTPVIGSAFQSQNYQKFAQAKSQFITALLRKESGAAISREEFSRYDREFFPQPGDGPEVVAQKSQARQVAIDAMKKGAGPGYKAPTATKPEVATTLSTPEGATATNPQTGERLIRKGGKWVPFT